jgi:hypothetical protein
MSRAGRVQPIGRAMRKTLAKVRERRLADEDHAVITVEGGDGKYRRKPCEDCPWRKDAVGKFPAEVFRMSANTATDGSHILTVGEKAFHTFGCHTSGADKPVTCAGYVIKGHDAVGWRIACSNGKFDPDKVFANVPLFDSYYEMAVANGVPPDDPALEFCKR